MISIFNINRSNILNKTIKMEPLSLNIMKKGFKLMFEKYPQLSDMQDIALIYLDKEIIVNSQVKDFYKVEDSKSLAIVKIGDELKLSNNDVIFNLKVKETELKNL